METIEREYEELGKALAGMPEGLYAVTADYDGATEYLFASVDPDGGWTPLGKATEDGEGGWDGRLDTRSVSFDDEDGLQAEFRRVMRGEAVVL